MTSADLRAEQSAALEAALTQQVKYLCRLVNRMDQLRWPHDDPLYARAMRARDALVALREMTQQVREQNAKPAWLRARDA